MRSQVIILSIALFSSLLFVSIPNADATEFVISEGNESDVCNSLGGTWYEADFNRICFTSNLVIDKGDSLIIESQVPVVLTGMVENNGEIIINHRSGSVLFAGTFNNNEGALFENRGIPKNDAIFPSHPDYNIEIGTINNRGTIDNFGGFTMGGKYQMISADTPDDHVVLENHGTLNNHAFMGFNPGSIVNNHGTINNSGQLGISTINNNDDAVFNNIQEGSFSIGNILNNSGEISNQGAFENRFCSGTINNSGTISGNPLTTDECGANDNNNMGNQETSNSENNNEGGGCLIATAAYGTELAPQVQFLREIRDNTVMSTSSGTAFMTGFNQLYYSFSPTIADMERENPLFQDAVRVFIAPMMSTLSIMTLADAGSEIEVLGLGISVIALNLGLYVVAPALVGFKIHRRIKNTKINSK